MEIIVLYFRENSIYSIRTFADDSDEILPSFKLVAMKQNRVSEQPHLPLNNFFVNFVAAIAHCHFLSLSAQRQPFAKSKKISRPRKESAEDIEGGAYSLSDMFEKVGLFSLILCLNVVKTPANYRVIKLNLEGVGGKRKYNFNSSLNRRCMKPFNVYYKKRMRYNKSHVSIET